VWSSADTDVSGRISNSAMSAAVEFHVDDFGVLTSKKSAIAEREILYV